MKNFVILETFETHKKGLLPASAIDENQALASSLPDRFS
jgi:hypothetical protein